MNVSWNLLELPEFTDVKQFFYIISASALLLGLFLLFIVSVFFTNQRREEMGIMRIYGARKSDIMLQSSLEILFLSASGALSAIIAIILLILSRILYLPYFIEGLRSLKLIKLIGISGQTLFAVIIIEIVITASIVTNLLKKDITELSRGFF
jgi:predicted lysophospholipase L1 biosynthesis ABC-type transport system permease subunit